MKEVSYFDSIWKNTTEVVCVIVSTGEDSMRECRYDRERLSTCCLPLNHPSEKD